jgi:hypothetical protein
VEVGWNGGSVDCTCEVTSKGPNLMGPIRGTMSLDGAGSSILLAEANLVWSNCCADMMGRS